MPVPGEELDKLLYEVAPEQQSRITATADSTAQLGAGLSARNLTDGDLTTAWIAGDNPTIHLSWPDKQPVGDDRPGPGGRPVHPARRRSHISSPDGAAIAGVDENGWVRFDPITTDRLDITVTETAPLTVHNPVADDDLQLPVGLTEAYIPALDQYRTPQPSATREFSPPLREGTGARGRREAVRDEREGDGAGPGGAPRRSTLTLCQEGSERRRVGPRLGLAPGRGRGRGTAHRHRRDADPRRRSPRPPPPAVSWGYATGWATAAR